MTVRMVYPSSDEVNYFQAVVWFHKGVGPLRSLNNYAVVLYRNPVTLQIQLGDDLGQCHWWRQVSKRSALAVNCECQGHALLAYKAARSTVVCDPGGLAPRQVTG